jgi:chromosomal replication initiation ATPase DnaA
LNLQAQQLQKLNYPETFTDLIRAAKGEDVPVTQLKISVAKVIEITMEKLNSNGRLSEVLSEARSELMKN